MEYMYNVRNVPRQMTSDVFISYDLPLGWMTLLVWYLLASTEVAILISPVDGRRYNNDYWSDRKDWSSRSFRRHTRRDHVFTAFNVKDEDDATLCIPSQGNRTMIGSQSSSTLNVTPASALDDDKRSNDINNISWNSLDMNALDRTIISSLSIDENDLPAMTEASDRRLRYQKSNHNGQPADDDTTGLLKIESRSSIISGSSSDTDAGIFPPLQTPIVYRYYPRHQSRTMSAGSVPFVLLGPNVDHWKLVAQQLSLRGFNVIAVGPKDQIIPTKTTTASAAIKTKPSYELGLSSLSSVGVHSSDANNKNSNNNNHDRYLEGPGLVLQLLDALRWKKVILVGCDSEATLAIQAALLLPSNRIAGLILCGTLEESEMIFLEYGTYRCGPFELDRFLEERLSCPFTIVWDGTNERTTLSSTSTILDQFSKSGARSSHRSVIIGGGTSPHRRRPGIFAWILTRFVEERIAPAVSIQSSSSSTATSAAERGATTTTSRASSVSKDATSRSSVLPIWLSSLPLWKLPARIPVLWNVDDVFNEESMVVFGRIVATAIFYAISLKVLVYQYGYIRDILDVITSTPRQIVFMVRNRIYNIANLILFIGRVPFMILPFGKRSSHTSNNVTVIENEGTTPSNSDQSGDPTDDAGDSNDEPEKAEPDIDPRPFFFLDHVVA